MKRLVTRIYVEAVGVLALAALGLAITQAVRQSSPLPLTASVPWLAAVGLIGGSKIVPATWIARTQRHPWPAYAIAAAGTVAAWLASPLLGAEATIGLAALLGYTLWYSRQHRPAEVVTLGEPLPAFPLTTVTGEATTSAALTHEPHVILFYRGSWCPFCMAQVKAVAGQYRELSERGVKVALISPQRAEDTEELSRRFDAPMDFYVDADGAAARVLDIVQEGGTPATFGAGTNGDTVVPTVIITRADGTVAWVHHAEDHRVRPEPSTFLEVIDREGIAVARRGA